MAYIALRPCSFGGEKFYVGDVVPNALIRPEIVRRLITAGVIAEAGEPFEMKQSEPETKVPKPAKKPQAKGKEAGDA